MKVIVFLLSALTAASAVAEQAVPMPAPVDARPNAKYVLVCSHEHFSVTYSAKSGQVTYLDMNMAINGEEAKVLTNKAVFVEIADADHGYEVVNTETGETILEISATAGSDGASDIIYPLSAKYGTEYMGCSSKFYQPIDPWNIIYDLQAE